MPWRLAPVARLRYLHGQELAHPRSAQLTGRGDGQRFGVVLRAAPPVFLPRLEERTTRFESMRSEMLSAQTLAAAVAVEEPTHTRQLPVLGVPVSYESDRPEVLDVVAEALSAWRSLDRAPWLVETRGVHIRIAVDDDDDERATSSGAASDGGTADGGARAAGRAREDGDAAAARRGAEDNVRRSARVSAKRAMLEDAQQFRYGPVEAATFALLESLDRAPVNAAAVARGGTALLLVGPRGAGKSTLAYAASRAGLKVLSDERVYVQSRPELRVWGMPGFLHLAADGATHFPELAGISAVRLANGTSRLTLDVERLGALPELPLARRVGVCLLRRDGSAGPEFARVHPERITMELNETSIGGEAYPDDMIALIARLAERGAWVLNASGHPSRLVPRVETMLEAVVGQPAAAPQTTLE